MCRVPTKEEEASEWRESEAGAEVGRDHVDERTYVLNESCKWDSNQI